MEINEGEYGFKLFIKTVLESIRRLQENLPTQLPEEELKNIGSLIDMYIIEKKNSQQWIDAEEEEISICDIIKKSLRQDPTMFGTENYKDYAWIFNEFKGIVSKTIRESRFLSAISEKNEKSANIIDTYLPKMTCVINPKSLTLKNYDGETIYDDSSEPAIKKVDFKVKSNLEYSESLNNKPEEDFEQE